MKEIKQKIMDNKLIVTQADKEKTIVIIQEQEYNNIVHDFINTKQLTKLTHDPVKYHQNNTKEVIKQCPEHIPKNQQ
jgi:UDP-glucose 4-epimerase